MSKKSNNEGTALTSLGAPEAMKNANAGMNAMLQAWGPLGEYMTDAMQRTILFWDVLRQRSDQYYAQKAKAVPHVLSFDAELVLDGAHLRAAGQLPAGAHQAAGRAWSSIRGSARSWWSIRAPATVRASAASRPTANWAWRCAPAIPATSSASPPSRCRARPSRTSCTPRRSSWRRSSSCTPRPKASPASSATARPAGR